jgi:hypothetical protein
VPWRAGWQVPGSGELPPDWAQERRRVTWWASRWKGGELRSRQTGWTGDCEEFDL